MDIHPLLHSMVEHNASDLFLSVGANVGIKIEGQIAPVKNSKLRPGQVKELVYSVMTPGQVQSFEDELELDFSLQLDGVGRFRTNVFRERNEVAAVILYIRETVPGIRLSWNLRLY